MRFVLKFGLTLVLSSLCVLAPLSAQETAPTAPEGMILVPAGEFTMGTAKGDIHSTHDIRLFSDAQPAHKVNVPAFYLDKTEVTNAQYKKFCEATGYPVPPHWQNGTFAPGEEQVAVSHVNWWEATAYAKWAGKRLPTEAEWEKAARGPAEDNGYPWGLVWDKERVATGVAKPQIVGQKPTGASPHGALDMAGNVFEWVQNWYAAYPGSTQNLPEFGKIYKVIRGGGFDSLPGFPLIYNVAYRSVARPQTRSEWVGFRCAKSIQN